MARLNLKAIEERIKPLAGQDDYDREFIFDLLLAYGRSKGNITRLRNGSLNIAEDPEHEVAQKNIIYFRETTGDLLEELERLRVSPTVVKFATRFVIVTDYTEMIAYDLKTRENRTFPLREIDQHFTFFLPWAGMEKAQYTAESHADVKAAEKMGTLFDELASANPSIMKDPEQRHGLNVFFTRLLFCYFAEDTGIFGENQFTNAVGSHTLEDGSDTADFIRDMFAALDEPDPTKKPSHLADFPYVNGRLFRADAHLTVPRFPPKPVRCSSSSAARFGSTSTQTSSAPCSRQSLHQASAPTWASTTLQCPTSSRPSSHYLWMISKRSSTKPTTAPTS
ncbi:type IIL restriction-modification enzyme MmeI [Corynebacterium sp. KPL2838]|uniref:type IIL restriction-modification enzyme MmeI n=1 Tax=Corynebacterium sp. KPL2838 TaxID=3158316 RepID=UPI0032F0909A